MFLYNNNPIILTYFVDSNSQDTALDYNRQHAEKFNMTPNSKQKNGFILLV